MRAQTYFASLLLVLCACTGPYPGPDKQGAGTLRGAATGAGAGAVAGFQLGAGTGPGAVVGAGVGAVAGGISGAVQDNLEESMMAIAAQTRKQREVSYAQDMLAEHLQRRLELHPTRDIFPADIFFNGGESKLRKSAEGLLKEIVRLNKNRLPWSRLAVASYVKSSEPESHYAHSLAADRALAISNFMIRAVVEPRRLVSRAVVLNEPLLIDPSDDPLRYNQAIELIPLDR